MKKTNHIQKRVIALLLAAIISLNMTPMVFAQANRDIVEETISMENEIQEIEAVEDIEVEGEIKNDYIEKKSDKTVLNSLEIEGDKQINSVHTINAKAQSKNGVLYQFYIKDVNAVGPAWTIIQEYSEKTSATWTPEKGGDYLYGVHVKDKNSKESLDTHLYIPITIKGGQDNIQDTILDSLDIVGNNTTGTVHTLNAKARSANGALYQFYIKDVNAVGPAWTIIQEYSEKTSATWTPEKGGDYLYGVHVKDKNSKESLDTHLYIPITIKGGQDTILDSLDIVGNNTTGTVHTLNAKARSANGALYQFYIKDLNATGAAWTIIQEYSEKTSATWTPKKDGDYLYGVHVKDKKSNQSLDTHLYKNITISPVPPAKLESLTITGLGYEKRHHTLTAKASSANGVLYEFYIKDLKTNKWEIIQSYSEKATANWKPEKAGKYWYGVHVKDKKSNKSLDANIYKEITINPPVYYNVTEYNDTLEEALDKQVGRNQISKNGKWVPATKDEIRQYLDADRFLQFKPEGNGGNQSILSVEITVDSLNIRQEPNTTSGILGTVKKGQVFIVLESKGSWYQINSAGKKGWVSNSYAKLTNDVPREMYQFMVLSGQAGVSTAQMNDELKGQGILEGKGAAFIEGSKKYNINELYLMAHAFLETGRGTSQLARGVLVSEIDGKPVTPKTVYNMYGIGAYDATALKSGSERAYKEGWFTPEIAITEGAHWISKNYINSPTYKQDTLYKMKYNPARPGTHQYATDIAWALKQTRQIDIMMEAHRKIDGALLRFDIPKYR